ncbi:hypothetical protein Taro_027817 [Colocasia esculenta]|uniref:Uncharacterized protein n=1 Tax=Colocasia esculenta TaxID=4460 RepID=A0A843VVE5_COLES|nr:hypothetical protein [Colocasia esculenta]
MQRYVLPHANTILTFRNPLPLKLLTDLGIGGFPRSSPGLLILLWFCSHEGNPVADPLLVMTPSPLLAQTTTSRHRRL